MPRKHCTNFGMVMIPIVCVAAAFFLRPDAALVRASNDGAAQPTLAGLAWLAGSWRTEMGNDVLEEHWMAPAADCMIGAFRWIKAGKLWMFEMLSITIDDGAIVLRIKHFNHQMVGWEEKDKYVSWKLATLDESQAVFENPQQDTGRLVFQKTGDSEITVVLEGTKDGKPNKREFHYKRVVSK